MGDVKMEDGNKESAKEILSTFRTIFAFNMAGLFWLLKTFLDRPQLFKLHWLFWGGVGLDIASAVGCIYLFFLMLPKIFHAEKDIIAQWPVMITSVVSFWMFVLGYFMTLGSMI